MKIDYYINGVYLFAVVVFGVLFAAMSITGCGDKTRRIDFSGSYDPDRGLELYPVFPAPALRPPPPTLEK